jgi:hypothetical protein
MSTMQQDSYQELQKALECYFTIDEQEYLFPILLSRAGDSSKAIFWFNNEPIPAFGNITALSVCASGDGKQFIDYIKSIQLGGEITRH